jgi:hypothetical protein
MTLSAGAGAELGLAGKCLDVAGAGTADGTKIQLYTCNGTGAQTWTQQTDGTILNPSSGKCLDVSGGNPADSTPVHLWTCHTGANQTEMIAGAGPRQVGGPF